MVKSKCIKINNDILENLEKDMYTQLKIKHIQSYFPILSLFFEFYNDSNTSFTLNSKYLVTKLLEPINFKKDDSYIKNFFEADILNQHSNEKIQQKIFTKILPILNVSQAMMNEYNLNHNQYLPNIHNNLTNKKINNYNNSAYIDSFFSYLGSILTETNKCPTFPLFYGTFNGVANEFMYDISEEYHSIKKTSWYKRNVNTHFKIHNMDIENDEKINNIIDIENDCQDINNALEPENENDNNHIYSVLDNESIKADNDSINGEKEATQEAEEDTRDAEHDVEHSNISNESDVEHDVEHSNISNESDGEHSNISNESDGEHSNISNESNGEHSDYSYNSREDREYLNSDDDYHKLFNNSPKSLNYDSISLNSSNLSLTNSDIYELNYCCFNEFPVQINCIEMLNCTLDNYIDNTNNDISEKEWKSILFQVCFGLAVAQKQYDFVHNDLHSSNIMFQETDLEYLYYNFKGTLFKIPTFGKISKIIDFGRATFSYKKRLFFSDVFKKDGEAEGQYNYPYLNNLNKCKIKPNKSFDLSRLSTTIIEHFEEDSDIYKLLKLWCMDKYGNFLMDLEDDFNLYRIIAKNVKSAVPKNQINKLIFKEFIIEKEESKDSQIYNY